MRRVLDKIAVAIVTLLFVLVFNFFLFRIAGDPIKDLIRGNPHLNAAGREKLIEQRGLRESYPTQFRLYVEQTLQGDLGNSFKTNQRVTTMIRAALPNTLILVGTPPCWRCSSGRGSASTPPPNAAPRATPESSRAPCSSTRCPTSGPGCC